ncbi:hypothetical protein DVK85_01595 [Flavobacterium arcticum]|uniref:Uncharacterized protein n=1 Tax=Flavobacterium arcticum TaxID=1784713 RepID=A0A345H8T6_9FLAO|nr:hypothetical protein [Flavobacterium arcticum]AXG72996.1 hypothetical protein DVK85_01595 [Flavobacterium arcticum]KAF2510340.1 hypothetical protein E0W72_07610 [Flavobacterium arcticum]
MKPKYEQLHEMEEDLIQLQGLLKALQLLLPDGAAHDCVLNALEKRLALLQQHFYEYWEGVAVEGKEESS